MTTLPHIGLVLPTRGSAGSGMWHDALDAQATLIDDHDHSSGKGKRINTDAISIDADLTLASYGITNIGKAAFAAVAALATGSKTLFVSSADNELYWRTNAGTNVKLTSGTSLNVSAFVGGIGGDYTSVSALVSFDDANDRYKFLQNAATGWARLASGEVRIYETGTSETVYVGIAAPAALAASYTITLPLAVPGSAAILQMDTSGVVSASNTVANLITASAGVTCAANQHVTVSGTGHFKHGSRVLPIGAAAAAPNNANFTRAAGSIASSGGACDFHVTAPLFVDQRVTSVDIRLSGDSSVDVTITVYKLNSDGTSTSIGTATVNNAGAISTTTIDVTDTTITADTPITAVISANAAAAVLYRVNVTYDL